MVDLAARNALAGIESSPLDGQGIGNMHVVIEYIVIYIIAPNYHNSYNRLQAHTIAGSHKIDYKPL